jgi:exodeoxyribonuclease V alpha subunit
VFVRPLTVLAGAAGTGKTTVIKAIVKAIKKGHGIGASVIALAPTGKAADRIREILERDKSLNGSVETSTIHSFLARNAWLNPNRTLKRAGGKIEQSYSTYIIDETSMLDLELAGCLFRAIDWRTVQRLILVGDPNQLPPIGCGRMFADIIDYLTNAIKGGFSMRR